MDGRHFICLFGITELAVFVYGSFPSYSPKILYNICHSLCIVISCLGSGISLSPVRSTPYIIPTCENRVWATLTFNSSPLTTQNCKLADCECEAVARRNRNSVPNSSIHMPNQSVIHLLPIQLRDRTKLMGEEWMPYIQFIQPSRRRQRTSN